MDWIASYLELTEGLPTPPVYRLWSGIFAIAAALERRTWLETAFGRTYPNLFCILVGPPGTGKSPSIQAAHRLLYRAKCCQMAPDDMTKAAMIDEMAEHQKRTMFKGETIVYHPLCVMVSELGNFINAHDLEFFSLMSDLFDNRETPHKSRRRGHNNGKAIELPNPSLNIMAGCPPDFLNMLLPEPAWQQGFCARLIMVYAGAMPATDMFAPTADRDDISIELTKGLVSAGKLLGPFAIEEEAKQGLRLWFSGGMKPVPEHERLLHYSSKRNQFILKLSMVAAVSSRCELRITHDDFERALSWLKAVEHVMPDIFRAMTDKSDQIIVSELWRFAWKTWVQSHGKVELRKPVHRASLMQFLAQRVPADKAQRILELTVQMDWLRPVPDSLLFVPAPRDFGTAQ